MRSKGLVNAESFRVMQTTRHHVSDMVISESVEGLLPIVDVVLKCDDFFYEMN